MSLADTDARGLVTKTEIIFKKSEIETRTFTLSKIEEFTLDQDKLTVWLTTAKKFVAPLLFPLALLGSLVFSGGDGISLFWYNGGIFGRRYNR